MKDETKDHSIETTDKKTGGVPAVELAVKILFFFTKNGRTSANLTEICQALGIYKSRGHAILKTLAAYGLITRNEETKRYSLGSALIHLSRRALEALDIRDVARPYLEKLAREIRGTALLGVINDDNLFVVAKQDGNSHLGITIRVGHRFHLTAGAHGKAITAFLPVETQKRLLTRKRLFFHGPPETLDRARLQRELTRCRETGFALDMGDLQPGIHAVASPVFSGEENVSGALIIVGTFGEATAQTYGPVLCEAAVAISHAMGARVPETLRSHVT